MGETFGVGSSMGGVGTGVRVSTATKGGVWEMETSEAGAGLGVSVGVKVEIGGEEGLVSIEMFGGVKPVDSPMCLV
jgi:hypothetical protein